MHGNSDDADAAEPPPRRPPTCDAIRAVAGRAARERAAARGRGRRAARAAAEGGALRGRRAAAPRCRTCAAATSTISPSRAPTTRWWRCSRKLDDFRGESRFTTWAYKFALLEAAVRCAAAPGRAARSRSSRRPGRRSPTRRARPPSASAEDAELFAALREAIETQPRRRTSARCWSPSRSTASRSTSSPSASARPAAPSTRPCTTPAASCAPPSPSAASSSDPTRGGAMSDRDRDAAARPAARPRRARS